MEISLLRYDIFLLFSLRSLLSFSLRSLCLSLRSSLFCNLLCRTSATTSLLLSLRSLSHVLIEVDKLDEAHRSGITWTNAQLDDTSVTSRTVSYASCNLAKELLDGIALLKITEDDTT